MKGSDVSPNICVGGILFRDNRILLAKRSRARRVYPGVWDILGGHSSPGEDPEQCLIREPHEEIGIIPTRFRQVATLDIPGPICDSTQVLYVFLVTDWTGEPRNLQPDEHSELAWFHTGEACGLDLALSGYRELFESLARM